MQILLIPIWRKIKNVLKSVFEALLSNSCKNAFEIKFIFQDMYGNLRFIDENILKKMHILEIFKIEFF